ncbi:MAG: hypothetical protein KF784_07150 [Fimbriimonadaceae bacterium]|nr:hypothetical protein [Fimbriimonadaceae bacterium]
MTTSLKQAGLDLTEEEALALLTMCLTSPNGFDKTSEAALKKLAEYCVREFGPECIDREMQLFPLSQTAS